MHLRALGRGVGRSPTVLARNPLHVPRVAHRAVLPDPRLDVIGTPDLAEHQSRHRLGERLGGGDLVGPLTTDTAQADPDLVGAEQL